MREPDYFITKIMIVDDDPDIIQSLKELFEKHGFEVTTAQNGRHCLLELEKGFQGIIILDLMMPVMDGVETIRTMSTEGFVDSNTIIVLTAKRIQGAEFDEIYPYIADYIMKPFNISDLLHVVQTIARRSPPKRRL
ncbi:MAG: response regulator [Candidatus Thermoplasmatota archaeon]|nr:response regulator [Candidatus Thermoplasmatota archaeon]